jgi:hypothetical protein
MTTEPQKNSYGRTVAEVLERLSGELPRDAVGLWQIVPQGRDGFGFADDELIDFVERGIRSLLASGAYPVRHVPNSGYDWTRQPQYGSSTEEIVMSIIAEWLAMPDDPITLCGQGVWFARPRTTGRHLQL